MKQKLIRPDRLTIEANASCQLRCPTCPTTSQGYPPVVGSGYLRIKDFINIVDSNPQITEVYLENRGELFLNPDLLAILQHAYSRQIRLYCHSGVNLNFIKEEILEGLVKYRFISLVCSLDGASHDTYKIYRIGGDFDRVINHIRIINHFKMKYKSEFPKMTWQFVVFGHNEHELPAAKKMARELGMDFNAKMSWDSLLSPIRNKEFVMKETSWPAVTREEYYKITGSDYVRETCFSLWTSPHINWDGKVLGCCWNSWAEFGGNAFKDGYVQSINEEKISYARSMLLGEKEFSEGLPCSTCELYVKNRETKRYLKLNEIFSQKRPTWRYSILSAIRRFSFKRNE